MKKVYPLLVMLCLLLSPVLLTAQTGMVASTDTALQKATGIFYSAVNDNAVLYNGTEYVMYDQRIKGTPYFLDGQQTADIAYNGTLYNNVPLIYELVNNNIVIREFGQGVFINLINQKVQYFTFFNHTFLHLVPDSTDKVITNDFYDRIYNGTVKVFVKRQKIVFEEPNTFEKSFVEKDHYFIYKNNNYYAVNDYGAVIDVFKDKKKDLVKYLRQNNIKYKKGPEYAIAKMAEYYDTLTH